MFPRLRPSDRLPDSDTGLFLLLLVSFGEAAFVDWAWRVPFLLSAVLVAIGLYVRVSLEETPAFKALEQDRRVAVPLTAILRDHLAPLIQGSLAIVVCYALFYISTVYVLGYGVRALGIRGRDFSDCCAGDCLHGACDPALGRPRGPTRPATGAARFRRRRDRCWPHDARSAFGRDGPRFHLPCARVRRDGAHLRSARGAVARALPSSRALHGRGQRIQSRRHPRRLVRAVLGSILEASGGVAWVGYYIAVAGVISFLAVFSMRETWIDSPEVRE